MIPDSELKRIIKHYWDVEHAKVDDYDFQKEALLATLILEMRKLNAAV